MTTAGHHVMIEIVVHNEALMLVTCAELASLRSAITITQITADCSKLEQEVIYHASLPCLVERRFVPSNLSSSSQIRLHDGLVSCGIL